MEYIASSAIITRQEDKKVLIGQRSKKKKIGPGEWETIGGSIEKGETPEKCIRREIFEELGTFVKDLYFFKDYQSDKGIIKVFVITLESRTSFSLEDFEKLYWVSEEEINNFKFALNCKERLQDYFASLNK